jgi:hypothetical protein
VIPGSEAKPNSIAQWPEKAEVSAKRALLRQQTQLLGEQLTWLSDPSKIPAEALGSSAKYGDLPEQCFNLAIWLLAEIVRAANSVQHELSWEETFDQYEVPSELKPRVLRAVLEPASRHAPGIFAISEIVAAAPVMATRESIPLNGWGHIARSTEKFGAKISWDGSDLQVLIRNYLRKPPEATEYSYQRVLNPALLRLDGETGVTSVTPIDDLISAAKAAITEHIRPAKGVCVAMLAKAPVCDHAATMYGAIWSAYAAAANRLIFPNIDLRGADIPPQAGPDPNFATVLDALARQRAAEWARGYPAKIWQAARHDIETVLAAHGRQQQTTVKPEFVYDIKALGPR